MLKTTSPLAIETKAKRGFGLIDVSLGIIAGIGLLVGAVILFQQVSTNNAVSEVTRNSVSISSEVRSAARNLPTFAQLPGVDAEGDVDGTAADNGGNIAISAFGLEPALTSGVSATAADQTFTLRFAGLSERACNRAAVAKDNLGANVDTATCTATGGIGTLAVTYNR